MERSSAILLAVSSLPSPYGIGTLGKAAYEFVDFLKAAGQSYWQLLPMGPTSYGDSPYQSFSTFAGNPYYIDLDMLIGEGLLSEDEVCSVDWGDDPRHVDYGRIYSHRFDLLKKAKERGWNRDKAEIGQFVAENKNWLPDYALFMALKRHFGMRSWTEWEDEDIRLHKEEAVRKYSALLGDEIDLFIYIQFLFFKQWNHLKVYAHENGVKFIGDVPIYVALDSSDVWAGSENFQLNRERIPIEVAGVPPDYFSEDGQLWGNPLYDYEHMEKDGFRWWVNRIAGYTKLYDVIRIDHFRGLESYWAVPFGDTTAKHGRWVKGPDMKLIGKLKEAFKDIEFIAEDLGYPTPEVEKMLKDSGFPGMKVLEFAFDAHNPSDYLPHRYIVNCICYTGTHDNPPLALWREETGSEDLEFAKKYLGLSEEEGLDFGIIRGGMSSVAKLFVAQMQDYLGLGKGHRMNCPGTQTGNWTWRLLPGEVTPALAEKIHEMTRIYGRMNIQEETLCQK